MQWLKQSTSVDIQIGPFVDVADGHTPMNGLAIVTADIRLSKNGAAFGPTNDAGGAANDENGWYILTLDATDTNTVGRLVVAIYDALALPCWVEFMVVPPNVHAGLVPSF